MGTWSNRPFGNDTALDWVSRLAAGPNDTPVLDALTRANASEPDASDSEAGIGAAALVAAASHERLSGIPDALKQWVRATGYVPSADLINESIEVIDATTANSELRNLWDESEALTGWLRATAQVRDRLAAALEGELPKRTPKKPGLPRNLGKLVERYCQDPDEKVLERIRAKLEKLADIEKATKETGFETPLNLVAEAGLLDEVKALVSRGANINAKRGSSYVAPLCAACRGDQLEVVRFLIDAGAELFEETVIDENSGGDKETYDVLDDDERKEYAPDPKWNIHRYAQAMWYAIRHAGIEVVELLESAGIDIKQQDLNGETLLHKAAHQGRTDMMGYLVKRGFDVNEDSSECEAPIYQAVRNRKPDAVQWLIDNGADVNRESWVGGAPLDYAEGDPQIAEMLRRAGALPGSD